MSKVSLITVGKTCHIKMEVTAPKDKNLSDERIRHLMKMVINRGAQAISEDKNSDPLDLEDIKCLNAVLS